MTSNQEDIKQQIGSMIQEARKAKGMTQKELAKMLNVSQSAVKGYESGKQNLTIETMHKLSGILGIDFVIKSE